MKDQRRWRLRKDSSREKQKKKNAGFTLAELMGTVTILVIVMGLAMVALVHYQRSLKLTQMDAAAKEIFVAAQNHMTAVQASGEWEELAQDGEYPGAQMTKAPSDYQDAADEAWPTDGKSGGHDFRYLYVPADKAKNLLKETILGEILPFGSLDDTIRNGGGCYVIEYDYATASVYGVFYTDNKAGFSYDSIMGSDGLDAAGGRTDRDKRLANKISGKRVLIGYYGGAAAKKLANVKLDAPEITVLNGDRLVVEITDPNYFQKSSEEKEDGGTAKTQYETQLKLTISGEESGNQQTYLLKVKKAGTGYALEGGPDWAELSVLKNGENSEQSGLKYTFVLDDITKEGGSFYHRFCEKPETITSAGGKGKLLLPGENLTVKAAIGSTKVLCASQKARAYTNSLFEEKFVKSGTGEELTEVSVSCIRHLQNLNPEISSLAVTQTVGTKKTRAIEGNTLVAKVTQTRDIDWKHADADKGMLDWTGVSIYKADGIQTTENSFYGIKNRALQIYDGGGNAIRNLRIAHTGEENSGLFTSIGAKDNTAQALLVRNVVLENAEVLAEKGDAGTLLGAATREAQLTAEQVRVSGADAKVQTTEGNAGGLVGTTITSTTIQNSLATAVVSTKSGNAGGLIGEMQGLDNTDNQSLLVTNSYAGGRTRDGVYEALEGTEAGAANIRSISGNAGGLIGKIAHKAVIQNSYSTCSAGGKVAGGLVGKDDKASSYTNCYSTGKVSGTAANAVIGTFLGQASAGKVTNCYYAAGINDGTLKPSGAGSFAGGKTVLPKNLGEWKDADFTDSFEDAEALGLAAPKLVQGDKLETYALDKTLEKKNYPFPTVNTTGAEKKTAEGVHYGDWQEEAEEAETAMLYYEKLKGDDTLYYHGYTSGGTELGSAKPLTAERGKYVKESGYLILTPKNAAGSVQVSVEDSGNKITCNRGDANEIGLSSDLAAKYQISYLNLKDTGLYLFNNARLVEAKVTVSAGAGTNVDFYMTPLFADSVRLKKQPEEKEVYYVRSVEQLCNLKDYAYAYVNRTKDTFLQTLDISYSEVQEFGYSGKQITCRFNNSIYQFAGTYLSQKSGGEGYLIDGITSGMFGNVTGTVKGVTLTNVKTTGSSGFANENHGRIESCSIRSKNPSDQGYADVNISGGAGFVGNNYGVIQNSYLVGTVNNSNAFCANNSGTIDSCYANCVTAGQSGFCGVNNAKAEIRNSHSLGTLTDTSLGAAIYGFVIYNNGTISGCYAALSEMRAGLIGGGSVYQFGQNAFGAAATGNYYLAETKVTGGLENLWRPIGTEKSYKELMALALPKASASQTHKYGFLNTDISTTYPFALPYTGESETAAKPYLTMQHYGDWPVSPVPEDLGLLYYEVIDGTYYYHGYASNGDEFVGGLTGERSAKVTEWGYAVAVPDTWRGSGNDRYAVGGGNYEKIGDGFTQAPSGFTVDEHTVYLMNASTVQKFEDEIQKIEFWQQSSTRNKKTFSMTPYFADAISTSSGLLTTFYIRTADQLQNLQEAKTEFAGESSYTFLQTMDIDASTLQTSDEDTGYLLSELKGTYRSDICLDERGNDSSYTIEGLTMPFIETVDGTVRNVVLTDVQIGQERAVNITDMGVFAKTNNGTLSNCGVRPSGKGDDTAYGDVTVSNTGDVAGFVNSNKAGGRIVNCFVVGAFRSEKNELSGFCKQNSGTIQACYTNAELETEAGPVYGFVKSNSKGGTITKCHVLGSIFSAEDAVGFLEKDSGTISDCYVALNTDGLIAGEGKSAKVIGGNGEAYTDVYYLNSVSDIENGVPVEEADSNARTYEELSELATDSEKATKEVTNRYTEALPEVYPFALPTGSDTELTGPVMQHYGDWPQELQESEARALFTGNSAEKQASLPGLAYYENDGSGYEGWYAVLAAEEGKEAVLYNTLRTDKNMALADTAASYGVLVKAGTTPKVSGAKPEKEASASVAVDGVMYDYYRIQPKSADHKEEEIRVTAGGESAAFNWNADFAAAVSCGKALGASSESGGTPYQIRTQQQLRNLNENPELYGAKVYRQTLDIVLSDENFTPIGDTETFSGSYDAGFVQVGKAMEDSTENQTVEDSAQIPQGYSITNLHQTVEFASADGIGHTGSDAKKNDNLKKVYGGLFGSVSGTLRNVNVSGWISLTKNESTCYMQAYVGSLAGENTGNLWNCNSDVVISSDADCGEARIGGLTGASRGNIRNSYYTGLLSGKLLLQKEENRTAYVGGLIGENTGTIEKSAASAIVNLQIENGGSDAYLGGLAGLSYGKDSSISGSFSKVCFTDTYGVLGGFVGAATGNEQEHTVFTDDYAIMCVTNPALSGAKGLFAGMAQQQDIWRCHASEMTLEDGTDLAEIMIRLMRRDANSYAAGGVLVKSSYSFLSGAEFALEAHGCYCLPGRDAGAYGALNAQKKYEFINNIYPTLEKNQERVTDVVYAAAIMADATVPEVPKDAEPAGEEQNLEKQETDSAQEEQQTQTQSNADQEF